MKTSIKKTITLLLMFCVVIGMVSGCAIEQQDDNFTIADVNEPIPIGPVPDHDWQEITITVMGAKGSTNDWNNTHVVKSMKEMFGVTMKCTPYSSDDWSTKLTLIKTDNELPDLLLCSGISVTSAGFDGSKGYYYLNFMDYIQYMPNLAKFLNEHPDYRKYVTAADGGIYGLPQYTESVMGSFPRNFITTSWLDNLGLEMPNTVDELYEVLKAFKEQDANGNGDPNDEIPMMWANYNRTPEHTLLPAFGIIPQSATANTYYMMQVDDNGKVYLADTTENYRAYLQYMNKLWEEELIYHESYTTDIKVQREWTSADKVGAFSDSAGWVAHGEGIASDDYYYKSFSCLTSDYNSNPVVPLTSGVNNRCWFVVSRDTEHPEEICRMLDYFFTEEGAQFGQEGDLSAYATYRAYEVPGLEAYEGWFHFDSQPKGYDSWETYRHQYQTINNAFNVRSLKGEIDDAILSLSVEELDTIIDAKVDGFALHGVQLAKRMKETGAEFVTGFPNLMFSEAEGIELASYQNDINSYCQTQKALFVTGELDINDDEEWQNFVDTINHMGLERLLEINQKAYDRMYGK